MASLSREQQDIINTILRVGRSMGADEKMLLAAIETGFVESGMRNLRHGDRDSQGVFQQRPSQGWGTVAQVTNVEHAARKFFEAAAKSKYRNKGTAGQLAQDVQRSAFPARYDQNEGRAKAALQSIGVPMQNISSVRPSQGAKVADYYRPSGGNPKFKKNDKVRQLAIKYGGTGTQVAEESALLNGLLALGYDPALVRSFADADPNRRYLDDAITRAIRGGVLEGDIVAALKATNAAARGDTQGALKALGKRRENLPPAAQQAWDAIANRQPLPFFDRGRAGGASTGAGLPLSQMPAFDEEPGPGEAKKQGPGQAARSQGTWAAPGSGGGPGAPGAPGTQNYPGIPNAMAPPRLPRTEAEVRAYIDENYSQWAYLQDIPEVWDRVKEAAKGGWSDDRVLGALQKTQWWQKTEASARVWKERRYQDPATTADEIKNKRVELERAAIATGITIPPNELDAMAEDALRFAWDPNETKAALGRFFKYDKDRLMGTALVTQQTLSQKARDWLVPMDDTTMQKWVTQVVMGEADEAYFDGYMKEQAQTLFPQLAEPISRGIAPGLWMSPYKSMAAQTLGINPDTIDLREAKWMKSINQVGPDGKRMAMNLSDWEDMLKTDETYGWDRTEQGREHGATMARKLAGMFGRNA